jgi:drug/metabolite transporter superfamily protein YnfA
MRLYYFTNISYKTLCYIFLLDFIKITFYPSLPLIYWTASAIFLDLFTGIVRSLVKGNFLVSHGLRKTLRKFAQYLGTVLLLFLFTNTFTYDEEATKRVLAVFGEGLYPKIYGSLTFVNNMVLLIMIYTEMLSISENLIGIDSTSGFSRWVLRPLHYVLSMAIVNNAFNKTSGRMGQEKNNTKTN